MMSEAPVVTKGRGSIQVDQSLYVDLEKPITASEWHTALLLPDGYEVEQIVQRGRMFEVTVLSADIPVDDTVIHTFVTPIVMIERSEENNQETISLTKVSISQWNGEEWHFKEVSISPSQQKKRVRERSCVVPEQLPEEAM